MANQYWNEKYQPVRHYVKFSWGIADNPGATGLRGATGLSLQGETGVQGVTGSQGEQGEKGLTGANLYGAQGIQGDTGVGVTGPYGDSILPGVTGILQFSLDGGDTSIQVGYRAQAKIPYDLVIESWEVVSEETGTLVTELRSGSYEDWASASIMNAGGTGPHIIDGIKNSLSDLSDWSGTTGSFGEYLHVNVLESDIKLISISLKHYEKR